MINTLTIITSNADLLSLNEGFAEQVHIAFDIKGVRSLNEFSASTLHVGSIFDSGNITFSIYLDSFQKVDFSKILEDIKNERYILVQNTFHPNYHRVEQKPVICFNSVDKGTPELILFITEMNKTFQAQGYNGIYPMYFSNDPTPFSSRDNFCFPIHLSKTDICNCYYDILKNKFYSAKYIGIRSLEIALIIQELKKAEDRLLQEQPLQFEMLKMFSFLSSSSKLLSYQLDIAKADLENQKKYLEILRGKDGALEIINFYKNEYEILPLWYKRFGHILKVITGKRSFRSLYDDNTKKYKL
ncbi:hypothetical protein ESA94_13295 [Lacibacter luteus]|uniref:Uncharacterized protein n=2 Tax=Lacibacter luteus TaxID=2508719 RepID=A0A4Q1CI19_9BACT|nr:hypothetical protein ESA94_13295 [Lacibacter luteus]